MLYMRAFSLRTKFNEQQKNKLLLSCRYIFTHKRIKHSNNFLSTKKNISLFLTHIIQFSHRCTFARTWMLMLFFILFHSRHTRYMNDTEKKLLSKFYDAMCVSVKAHAHPKASYAIRKTKKR
jgi:hypothetical protein